MLWVGLVGAAGIGVDGVAIEDVVLAMDGVVAERPLVVEGDDLGEGDRDVEGGANLDIMRADEAVEVGVTKETGRAVLEEGMGSSVIGIVLVMS